MLHTLYHKNDKLMSIGTMLNDYIITYDSMITMTDQLTIHKNHITNLVFILDSNNIEVAEPALVLCFN